MASASNKTSVLLFGASGRLGFSLYAALNTSPYSDHFSVSVHVRPASVKAFQDKCSTHQIQLDSTQVIEAELNGDSTVEALAEWMKESKIVVSTLAGTPAAQAIEPKLFQAAKLAKVSWYIPSLFFAFDFTEAVLDSMPFLLAKKQHVDSIRSSGLNSIFIITGIFTDLLLGPLNGVDLNNAVISAPYSFDAKVGSTTREDAGKLTAQLLLQREDPSVKNQIVHISADTVSYEQIHVLLEEHYKKDFKKVVVSREEGLAAVKADSAFRDLPGRLRVLVGEQKGVYWNEVWNAKHAPQIQLTTVKQFIQNLK